MSRKHLALRATGLVAPLLHRTRLTRLIDDAAAGFAFLGGQGAGAGWDHANEAATAARFVRGSAPVILDVGANRGEWTRSIAALLRDPAASFHLFEVAPYCFDALDTVRDDLPQATLHRLAVSEYPGEATFHLPCVFSGLGSLHARADVGVRQLDYDHVTVPTVSLDSFAERHAIERIALVKLDIEGHELFALRGAANLLKAQRIAALTFEFGSANVNSRTFFRDLWDLLDGAGYRLRRMLPGGGTVAIERYSERLEYFRGATNYVAHLPHS